MPAQWRTIGPLVGRTGGQCQERYERLLDEAAGGGDEETSGSAARKLRPGEIDPHPETKPARPDPIDMDEDEIEMLQEARARLANTQGKKAKRKTREKMLNEAKRLADLQKRRELKAAGLLDGAASKRGRNRREIDLGVEIPFHKPAPAGFHSTREEDEKAETIRNQRLKDVDYKRIREMQYRSRDREAKEKQKREEARIRSLERSNMQYVVAEVSKRNDPMQIGKGRRGELTMPEPMVGEDELRRVGKATEEEREAMAALEAGGTKGATDALLGDYSDRPLPTPMRTPAASARGPTKSELIQREALNLRALSTGQTPLLGEENAELIEGGAGTGTSLNAAALGATPIVGRKADDDDDTANFRKGNPTPLTFTSRRDELGLNSESQGGMRPLSELRSVTGHDDAASVGASSFGASTFASKMSLREMAREERRRAKRARQDLEEALKNLPAPQFDYELAVPEDVTTEEDDDTHDGMGKKFRIKDAAEEDREELERLRKEAERLYEEQSSVIKRPDLPRPRVAVSLERLNTAVDLSGEEKGLELAAKLVNEEMMVLIGHDTFSNPVAVDKSDPIISALASDGKKKDKKDKKRKHHSLDTPPSLEYFSEETLLDAKQLLEDEMKTIAQEKRELLSKTGIFYENDSDILNAAAQNLIKNSIYPETELQFNMDNNDKGWTNSSNESAKKQNLHAEYAAIQNALKHLDKSCSKLQQKLEIQTGGYSQRSKTLIDSSYQTFAELQHSKIEESVYSCLRSHETRGASLRIERMQEEVEGLEEEEAKKQKKYGELMHMKNRLMLQKNNTMGKN